MENDGQRANEAGEGFRRPWKKGYRFYWVDMALKVLGGVWEMELFWH